MNIRRLINQIIAFACLTMMSACYNYDGDIVEQVNTGDCYINLAISVSNGNKYSTRAGELPTGGEDGDGREAGFERENTVTGITLILYKDANGINTSSNPTLDLVRYFPVTKVGSSASQGTSYEAGTAHGEHANQIEAKYTTGPQLIGKYGVTTIDFTQTYHAIVIANYNLTGSLTEGTSTLNDVRDVPLSTIYSADNTKAANLFTNFVMTSEEDNTLNFAASGVMTEDASGDKIYSFDDDTQALVIERMAARIDFWSKGGTYDNTYPTPGYVYQPWKSTDTGTPSSADRFVVTRITPFNLNAGTEYLLKRTSDAAKYLASETGSNYVIDPTTSTKTDASIPTYFVNALSGIATLTDLSGNDYCHTIASLHELASVSSTIDGNENVIICYPMENTLPAESPLYYYATGIVIEGDYYIGNNTTDASKREHRVYFGYIRHQGESSEAYDALLPSELDTSVKTSSSKPMNFGIVRNNIYRISIDKVTEKMPEEPRLIIKIEETRWRHVDNPAIYI